MNVIAPFTPPDCSLTGIPYMPVETERLLNSEFWLTSTPEVFRCAFALWCRAWAQTPAASLPNEDHALAMLCNLSLKRFRHLRAKICHGWILCADGRLYHPLLAERALNAWLERVRAAKRSSAGNAKQGKKFTPAEVFDAQIRVAEEHLERLLIYRGNDRFGRLGIAPTMVTSLETKAEGQNEAQRKEKLNAKLDNSKRWATRLIGLHQEFSDVLDDITKPDALQDFEDKGFEWASVIKPGLETYLVIHRSRLEKGTVQKLKSFAHPAIKECIENRAMGMARGPVSSVADALTRGAWRKE